MQEDKNPWTRLKETRVYENPWIDVFHDEVLNPSGNPGIYGRVHMKNYALGIIPIDEEGYTWLVGQYRYTPEVYSWEIPMGGGLLENDPLTDAKRELLEETGLVAKDWEFLLKVHTTNSISDEIGLVYVARNLEIGKPQFEETEKIELKRLPLREAFEWVMEGKITDSISVAALLKMGILLSYK